MIVDFLYSPESDEGEHLILRLSFSSVRGLRLVAVAGPLGLPGFCNGVRIPSPIDLM